MALSAGILAGVALEIWSRRADPRGLSLGGDREDLRTVARLMAAGLSGL